MSLASLFFYPPPPPYPRRRLASPVAGAAHISSSAPSPPPKALFEIEKSGVIACLRAQDGKLAMEAARAALSGGISVLEIVMSTPGDTGATAGPPFIDNRRYFLNPKYRYSATCRTISKEVRTGMKEVIKRVLTDVSEQVHAINQVGTVLNVQDARDAVKAGAKFLMSPGTVMEILFDVQDGEVLYIPGVMTPTEVLCAYNAGARIVKVYPVSLLGGVKYISTIKRPFPHIPMVASQGITIDSVRRYLEGGASAVVLSDAIFEKEAMKHRNFDTISRLAHLATLQGGRTGKC